MSFLQQGRNKKGQFLCKRQGKQGQGIPQSKKRENTKEDRRTETGETDTLSMVRKLRNELRTFEPCFNQWLSSTIKELRNPTKKPNKLQNVLTDALVWVENRMKLWRHSSKSRATLYLTLEEIRDLEENLTTLQEIHQRLSVDVTECVKELADGCSHHGSPDVNGTANPGASTQNNGGGHDSTGAAASSREQNRGDDAQDNTPHIEQTEEPLQVYWEKEDPGEHVISTTRDGERSATERENENLPPILNNVIWQLQSVNQSDKLIEPVWVLDVWPQIPGEREQEQEPGQRNEASQPADETVGDCDVQPWGDGSQEIVVDLKELTKEEAESELLEEEQREEAVESKPQRRILREQKVEEERKLETGKEEEEEEEEEQEQDQGQLAEAKINNDFDREVQVFHAETWTG